MAGIYGSKPVLGEKHFKNVRKIYLDDKDMDDVAYPILIYKVDPKDVLRNIVRLPARGKDHVSGVNLVAFMGGGFEFRVIVQSHNIPSEIVRWRLSNEGTLIIPYVRPSARESDRKSIEAARAIIRKNHGDHKKSN